MASTDRTTRLTNIRNQLESEVENETLRRLNLTVAGHPPPTTYTSNGRQLDWNGYLTAMQAQIAYYDQLLQSLDASWQEEVRGYS